MRTLRQDVRYALRALRRNRHFATAAVGSVAVGTGIALALLRLASAGLTRTAAAAPPADAPIWERGWSASARTVAQIQAESLDALLRLLGAATVLAMLVVCVNLGILLLARASAQRPELTLRAALGATRRRLSRQLLTEAGVLCLLGGTLGFIASGAATAVLHATWPSSLPLWTAGSAGAAASALAVGLPVLTAVVFGLSPIVGALRRDLHRALAGAGRMTGGRHEAAARGWLGALAVAASVALLVGSGLLWRSFGTVAGAQPGELGYDARDTLTWRVEFVSADLVDPAARTAAQAALLDGLAELPGVRGLGLASAGALVGVGTEDLVSAVCGDCFRGGMWLPVTRGIARHHVVSPGYFEALGVPILGGRALAREDGAGGVPAAVVSRTLVNRIFTGRDPVGRQIQIGGRDGVWHTVVGVVGDVRARGLGTGAEPVPALYLSSLQHPPASADLAVRTRGDPAAQAPALETAMRSLQPAVVGHGPLTLETRLAEFAAPVRWFAGIFAAVAAIAASAAGLGLFGIVAYSVASRTREIGVRIALGARPGQVVWLVVRQSLRLAAAGTFFGVLAGLCIGRLLQVLFLGVQPFDASVYAAAALLLLGVALAASYLPARDAARIDPLAALRYE